MVTDSYKNSWFTSRWLEFSPRGNPNQCAPDANCILHMSFSAVFYKKLFLLLGFYGQLSNKDEDLDCPEGNSEAVQDSPEQQKEKD